MKRESATGAVGPQSCQIGATADRRTKGHDTFPGRFKRQHRLGERPNRTLSSLSGPLPLLSGGTKFPYVILCQFISFVYRLVSQIFRLDIRARARSYEIVKTNAKTVPVLN